MKIQHPVSSRIHFIEKEIAFKDSKTDPSLLESGYWLMDKDFTEATALELVNKNAGIYFHQTRKGKSYMGGELTGHRLAQKGEIRPGSIIFIFKRVDSFTGVEAGEDGWEPRDYRGYRKVVM